MGRRLENLEQFGIDVVLIEPGPYRTEIWSSTKWVVPANSAYLSWLKLLRQAADRHQARTSGDPKGVAAVIAKALEARRPRFRYQVGFFAKLYVLVATVDAGVAWLAVAIALNAALNSVFVFVFRLGHEYLALSTAVIAAL